MPSPRIQKAGRFLKDAEFLFHAKRFDSCVSRCYYTLYHLMIVLIEKHGVRSREWGHQFVPSEFGRMFVHRKKIFPANFTDIFYDIQRDRNEADYGIQPVSFKRAKRTFDKTQNLWNLLYKEVKHEQEKEKRQGTYKEG